MDWGNSFRGDDIKEIEVFVDKNLEDDNTDIGYTQSDLNLTWKDNEDDAADNIITSLVSILRAIFISVTIRTAFSKSKMRVVMFV